MNETEQPKELAHESVNAPNVPISRRAVLVGGAGAMAVGVAGLAAGIAVGAHEVPSAPLSVSARQRFANIDGGKTAFGG